MNKLQKGTFGWILLALFVFLWDALAPDSLSAAYNRGINNPRKRPIVLAATVWTLSHLLFKKPARILVKW